MRNSVLVGLIFLFGLSACRSIGFDAKPVPVGEQAATEISWQLVEERGWKVWERDTDSDGRSDSFEFFLGEELVRREIDHDRDGLVDVVQVFTTGDSQPSYALMGKSEAQMAEQALEDDTFDDDIFKVTEDEKTLAVVKKKTADGEVVTLLAAAEDAGPCYKGVGDPKLVFAGFDMGMTSRAAAIDGSDPDHGSLKYQPRRFFPGGGVRAESYPLMRYNLGPCWAQMFGVQVRGSFFRADTNSMDIQGPRLSGARLSSASNYSDFAIDLMYQWHPLGEIPQFRVIGRLGYHDNQMDIPESSFPTAKYSGATVGGQARFTYPFYVKWVDQVDVFAGADITPLLMTAGQTKKLGTIDYAFSVRGEAGLRLHRDTIYVGLDATVHELQTFYSGGTTLETTKQYTDATLSDRSLSFGLVVGMLL